MSEAERKKLVIGVGGFLAFCGFVSLASNAPNAANPESPPLEASIKPEATPSPASTVATSADQPATPTALAENLVAACKASLALMNSRDVASFKGRKIDDVTAHVSWVRSDDGKRWQARCEMVDDTHLRWAAFDAFGDGKQGRWRDEDRIEVKIQGSSISVSLEQSGLDARTKTFSMFKLT